jgi:hypothetical protein
MSDAKVSKKVDTAPKKPEAAKPEATKPEVLKPEVAKSEEAKTDIVVSEAATVDNSAKKAEPSPKSASQASISHFSSVSTPEYRSGWDSIFGGGKDAKKTASNGLKNEKFPKKFVLKNTDINAELRYLLDETLKILAKKQGVSLNEIKKIGIVEYNINCNIT